jgi:hypothetical protein
MQSWTTKRLALLAVTLAAAGCSRFMVHQQPLMTDHRPRPPSTDRSLVLGGAGHQDQWVAQRNDGTVAADRKQRPLYYGPGGDLYYKDGSSVKFDSVRKQLQDQRIP